MASRSAASEGRNRLSAGRITATLLLSFLVIAPNTVQATRNDALHQDVFLPPGPFLPHHSDTPRPTTHTFSLRNIFHHGTDRHPTLHRRQDVIHEDSRVFLAAEENHDEEELIEMSARSRPISIERLRDRRPAAVDPIVAESRRHGFAAVFDASAWTTDDVSSPDVTDKETVLTLARAAADAYVKTPDDAEWQDIGEPYNKTHDFGWEGDGLRGHIWADENNSTVIIGLKGTSMALFDGEGTTTNDKINDNLFFGCCCGQQGSFMLKKVCDCATGTYSCNNTCVVGALMEENRYYTAARELYSNVTEIYPNSNIWFSGHSLGGSVSAMLGLTYGLPVVTFQAVPDALAASRLGLPVPPGIDPGMHQTRHNTGAYHFGHNADPIYVGSCNGVTASCSFAGYALETVCHTGQECIYDVVNDKGWRVGVGTHRIRSVIKDVILVYDDVPQCEYQEECQDCPLWKMYESNGTESTTTSPTSTTTTHVRTRTETCETPGWWGCLDKSTTTEPTSTTTSETSTTTTCHTPGWFGCNDKSTSVVTSTLTSTSTSIAPTTTCETPGWFGCNDKTTSTVGSTVTTTSSSTTCDTPGWFGCNDKSTTVSTSTIQPEPSPTSTCETPGRIWGCWDKNRQPTTTETGRPQPCHITSAPTATSTTPLMGPAHTGAESHGCTHRNWLGFCSNWGSDDSDLPSEI